MLQAMIFAAGMGTRLKPLTDTMPKALVRVGGQPLIYHVIHRLKAEGVERIVVNVYHFADQIIDYLQANDHFGLDIRISDEREMLLETGGGVKKARRLFDLSQPVIIHNVDILSNASLGALLSMEAEEGTAASVLLVSERETTRYLLFDDDMRLRGWTNIQTGEVRSPLEDVRHHPERYRRLAFAGIHALSPTLFPLMEEWPERFSIIDFYLSLCHKQPIFGYCQQGLSLLDVGKLNSLGQAEILLKELQRLN